MTVDLFDATWVLLSAAIVVGGLSVILRALLPWPKKPKKIRKQTKRRIAIISVIAILVSCGIYVYVANLFPSDAIPVQLILWSLPFGISIGTFIFSIIAKKLRILAFIIIPISLILGMLITNIYYQFYPTLGSIFSKEKPITTQNTVTRVNGSRVTPLEAYYEPMSGQPSNGKITNLVIPSSGNFKPRAGFIYIPPAVAKNNSLKLPVIVLLAGYPGAPMDWVNAGLEKIMDSFAQQHEGLAPIVAVVDATGETDHDTECVNSKLGDVETYLTKDVPTYLKKHYQIIDDESAWAIGGYSAGGTCGTTVAVRNPDIYRTYINITGDSLPSLNTPAQTLSVLFGGSAAQEALHNPTEILTTTHNPSYKDMHAWYYMASQDSPTILARVKEQATAASHAGVDVMLQEVTGHHGFYVWKQGFIDVLPWYMRITNIIY